MKELDATKIWRRYEKGLDYLNRIDLPNKTRRSHRFYDGDQWYGIKSGGEELPSLNLIKGIVKYKVTSVAQNNMTAVFSSVESDDYRENHVCQTLGKYFSREWEAAKLDSLCRQAIKDAAIQGDSYIYFGNGDDLSSAQIIDNVNIFLSDEQNSDIQEQKYIILRERRFVEDIRKEAVSNGVKEDDISLIVSDRDTHTGAGSGIEVDLEDGGKCISLLYMEKDEDGYVHVSRSVKNLVYQEDTILRCGLGENSTGGGLKSYPLVNFLWEDKKGSARGNGEVEYLIPNQIEINKTVARRSIAVKQTAFPMIAYASNLVNNPDELETIGGKIAVNNGNAQSIDQIISYLRPASISPDAKNLSDELLLLTRDLAGAGNTMTGNIDPTQASGTAIIAVRDQAQLPLNEQVSRYMQLVEDLARLFIDMWIAYNPKGIYVKKDRGKGERISVNSLEKMKINIRVDVMKVSPFNLYATEQSLQEFFKSGAISLEEFVEALPEGGSLPKNKLREILSKREEGLEDGVTGGAGNPRPGTAPGSLRIPGGRPFKDSGGNGEALLKDLKERKAMLEGMLAKSGGNNR